MKKMKIVVTAIIVTAAVGAGLAFKVNNVNGTFYCSSSSGGDGGVCGTSATRYVQNPLGVISLYCNISPGSATTVCPDELTQKLVVNN